MVVAEPFQAVIRGGKYDGDIVTFEPVAAGTPLKDHISHNGVRLAFLGDETCEPVVDEETGLDVLVEVPER